MLWGENDVFLEHHVAQAALALCDDGRLSVITGATHWLRLEEPARVNAALTGSLSAQAGAAAGG